MKQDLNDMAYFSAVAQHKGFTAASKALGISKSLLSRRVAELESRIGIRLLNRSSRQFSVTEIGEQYAEQCRRMLDQAELAQQLVDDTLARPKGRLTISAPVTMTETFMAPLISDFLKRHEDVQITLLSINRDVDIIEEGIDISIRIKPLPLQDSGLHFRSLARGRDILAASPELIRNCPKLDSIHSLTQLPTLSRDDNMQNRVWTLEHPQEGRKKIPINPRLVSNNLIVLMQAALHGAGIVLLPKLIFQRVQSLGELVQVFEEWHSQESLLHAVFASNKGRSSAFRAFMAYLTDYFENPQAVIDKMQQPDLLSEVVERCLDKDDMPGTCFRQPEVRSRADTGSPSLHDAKTA